MLFPSPGSPLTILRAKVGHHSIVAHLPGVADSMTWSVRSSITLAEASSKRSAHRHLGIGIQNVTVTSDRISKNIMVLDPFSAQGPPAKSCSEVCPTLTVTRHVSCGRAIDCVAIGKRLVDGRAHVGGVWLPRNNFPRDEVPCPSGPDLLRRTRASSGGAPRAWESCAPRATAIKPALVHNNIRFHD